MIRVTLLNGPRGETVCQTAASKVKGEVLTLNASSDHELI